jgi:hypothetical protein
MNFIDFNNVQEIKELFAAVSIDNDGNEGICSLTIDSNTFPVVFGYEKILNLMKPFLIEMSQNTTKKIQIVKFTNKEIIEIIDNRS